MSHPKQVILRDSRNRVVLCTMAKDDHDDQLHFACCFCDGDFMSFNSCKTHIQFSHMRTTVIEPPPIIKTETPMDVDEIYEISDDELETISISSDEPEEVQPNGTSANAQNPVIVTSVTMQNGINGPANMTNGEVINQSQTNEPQPSTSTEMPKQSAENKEAKTAAPAESTGHQMSNETHMNGKQPSDGNQTTQQKQSQQQEQSKPLTNKEDKATSEEETDDDVSSISSIESENDTALNRPKNDQRQTSEKTPNDNQSDMAENYPCQHCPETFTTFAKYRAHEYSCEAWRTSMFSCPVEGCPKRFAYRKSRDYHIDKNHKNFGFACGICVRRFLSEKQKREHQIKMHTKTEIKPCFFCETECYSNHERNIHVQKCHMNGMYFHHHPMAISSLWLKYESFNISFFKQVNTNARFANIRTNPKKPCSSTRRRFIRRCETIEPTSIIIFHAK